MNLSSHDCVVPLAGLESSGSVRLHRGLILQTAPSALCTEARSMVLLIARVACGNLAVYYVLRPRARSPEHSSQQQQAKRPITLSVLAALYAALAVTATPEPRARRSYASGHRQLINCRCSHRPAGSSV